MTLLASLTLSSCKSTAKSYEVEIPEIHVEVEKPVLEQIPELDVDGWTDDQIQSVVDVISVYNLNMGRLVNYAEALEEAYALKTEYYENIIDILRR